MATVATDIRKLRTLYQQQQRHNLVPVIRPSGTVLPPATRVSGNSGQPYQSAASTRRTAGWSPSRLGPTGVIWGSLDVIRARCRDEVRNNPWAAGASDNFEAQTIGTGIKPHWQIPDPVLKKKIEDEFARWARDENFYGMQATAAREIFDGGEVFARRHIRPASWGLRVPLQVQLLEGEQCPIFLNSVSGGFGAPQGNSIRTGIEFENSTGRCVAYHMYQEHPGEAMFYPMTGLQYVRLPATDIFHTFKPLRAGLLRGIPYLSAVINTLHELDKYMDASVISKQVQTMFTGFVTKLDLTSDLIPTDTATVSGATSDPTSLFYEPGVDSARLEPGTLLNLSEGENVTFPNLPQNSDIETFLRVCLHQFAVGIGATYEQITGDLKGVNLSSIRAGILDFRRKCEQFQTNVIISRLVHPIVTKWWIPEAILAGVISLPGYFDDPGQYENITWRMPGWPWIDPKSDAEANQLNVRSGFSSREQICAEAGEDSVSIDQQQVSDNQRADAAGLVYESDSRVVLTRGESVSPEGAVDEGASPEDGKGGDLGQKDKTGTTDTAGPSAPASKSKSPVPATPRPKPGPIVRRVNKNPAHLQPKKT